MNTILISGAAAGIGAATARRFHAAGWHLGLLDVNESALVELAAELGERVWWQPLDVSDPQAVADTLAAFAAAHDGHLRVLFNCAGILKTGAFADIAPAQHRAIIDINVSGLLMLTHAAFPFLRATTDACVINMSSASAVYGVPDFASYSASKFAVRGLTEALNVEWQQYGIRVLDIMPPFVRTAMVAANHSPIMDRLGVDLSADDVAAVVWQAANDRGQQVHWPVGRQFRATMLANKLLPVALTRGLMRWLSRA